MYKEIHHPYYKHGAVKANKSRNGGICTVLRLGRDFCKWSSMHGCNHVAAARRHRLERLLWACVLAAAMWGAAGICLGQWQRYRDNPTVVTLEKDFRTWSFSYPAITLCYKNRVNVAKLPAVIKKRWNTEPGDEMYLYYAEFVTAVANSDLYNLKEYLKYKDDPSLEVDLFQLAVDVMPDLELKAVWSAGGKPRWFPVMTESGACFVTNCLAIGDSAVGELDPNDTRMFPLKCEYASMSCSVNLEVATETDFYVHSPYDSVDTTVPAARIFRTLNRHMELSVTETRSGRGVRALSPRRRRCLYTDEPSQPGRRVYSSNSCRLSCRSKLAVNLCGCTPFYYFYEGGAPPCPPAGLACLAPHAGALRNTSGVRCACAQQCHDSVFKEVAHLDQYWKRGPLSVHGYLKLTVQVPRTRYTREIVFHFQDLVVSFGGAAGLFLGASFISVVEIVYFLFSRVVGALIGGRGKTAAVNSGVKNQSVSYETERIKRLTSILENHRYP